MVELDDPSPTHPRNIVIVVIKMNTVKELKRFSYCVFFYFFFKRARLICMPWLLLCSKCTQQQLLLERENGCLDSNGLQ